MRCVVDSDLDRYADRVLPHLHRDPVRNNLASVIIEARCRRLVPVEPGALWLRVVDQHEELVAAALRTPPYPLVLTAGPAAAVPPLVAYLAAHQPELPMVNGPADRAAEFADQWRAATGASPTVAMRTRMFRLDAVTPPGGVPGRARPATAADRDRLAGWVVAFRREALPDGPHLDPVPMLEHSLRREGAWWLWEDAGEPVSMLATSPPAAGVVRIQSVYTPPERRGHGYASGCTAAASQWALDRGADVCALYTDQANPTSNRIYQAIGYRPVGDATLWRLAGAQPARAGTAGGG